MQSGVPCPRVRQLVIKRAAYGRESWQEGRKGRDVKGSKHVSAPGRRVCVQNTRDQRMDAPPSPPQPALSVFFHFEVPAMWQHLGHLTTGTKGSRRVPFRQQQVAELVSLLACPALQDGSAQRSQLPGRAFLSLVCSTSQPLGRPLACRVSRDWLLRG